MFKEDIEAYKELQNKLDKRYMDLTNKLRETVRPILKKHSLDDFHSQIGFSTKDLSIDVTLTETEVSNEVTDELKTALKAKSYSTKIIDRKLEITFNY